MLTSLVSLGPHFILEWVLTEEKASLPPRLTNQVIAETHLLITKLQKQPWDRTGYSGLCRNWNPTRSQGRSQWFAKKTEDCFFSSYTPQEISEVCRLLLQQLIRPCSKYFPRHGFRNTVSTFQFWSLTSRQQCLSGVSGLVAISREVTVSAVTHQSTATAQWYRVCEHWEQSSASLKPWQSCKAGGAHPECSSGTEALWLKEFLVLHWSGASGLEG